MEADIIKYRSLSMSFLSSLLELGPILMMAGSGASLTSVILVGLAYQIGNLVSGFILFPHKWLVLFSFLSVLCALGQSYDLIYLYISVACASVALQGVRRYLKKTTKKKVIISSLAKRTARIVGFAFAGIIGFANYIWLPIAVAVFASQAYRERINSVDKFAFTRLKANPISVVMLIHQCHYFSYAYLIPFLFIRILGIPNILAGFVFTVGWISYASIESLVRKYNPLMVFVTGHILVALSLYTLGMFYQVFPIVLALWFVSGLGGGTVYCLSSFNESVSEASVQLEPWEDIGHLFGVLVSVVISVISPLPAFDILRFASMLATVTFLGMLLSIPWLSRLTHSE